MASRTVASVAPKLMARVINVRVNLGSVVAAGDVLITLDARDVRAQVQQAHAALAAAQAQAARAASDQRRVRTLFKNEAATQQDLDAVTARATAARAQVAQTRDALTAAKVALSETTVRAPFDGIIAQRLVDPGDMAVPGQPLVVIQDPAQLRLETRIAERCAGLLAIGMEIPVRFETPRRDVTARIEEIAPMADPRSRTFLVKAALSPAPGLRPGIFGALRASCGTHVALLIPAPAVTRIGQLETARVMIDGVARMRNLKTGKTYGDRVEVLSGLRAGEMVLTGG
ncbi:MAG: efflux RND transporter periplasmic adaptor subunit [Candidatus Binatia bacterium]